MSLLRLNEHEGKFLVLTYADIRRSPIFDSVWEVSCIVVNVADSDSGPLPIWIPIAEIGRYPVGSLVGRRPGKLVANSRRLTLQRFTYSGWSETTEDRHYIVELFQPRQTVRYDWNEPAASLLYGNDQAGSVIDARELFRFYCGNVGLLAATLLEAVHTETAPLDALVDPRETGWDGKDFVISPRRSFCGTGCVLQLALALSDEAMNALIGSGLHNVKRSALQGAIGVMTLNPQGPLDLIVEAETIDHRVGDKPSRKILAARRIISDLRPPTFRELIVRYPFAAYRDHDRALSPEGQDDAGGRDEAEEHGRTVTLDTRLTRGELPSTRTFRVGALGSRFGTAFPAWRGARIRYDYAAPSPARSDTTHARTVARDATVASTLPGTSSGTLVRVLHAPTGEQGLDPGPVRPRQVTPFITEEAIEVLEPRLVPAENLPLMMRTFLRAGVELLPWQDLAFSPNVPGLSGEALVYVMPPNWGGIARLAPDGRFRRMAALPLTFPHGFVWAVEIERRNPAEQFAIGLVAAHTDVSDELELLNNAVYEVSRRWGKARGEDPHGTWPDADYTDVKLGSVIHSRARAHHVNLADALLARSRHLLRPSTDF